MSRIALPGCRPEPLASYLKALAVLRLIAEQRDSEARGWWENEVFNVDSVLDEQSLLQFFVEHYRPTPLLAPWGGRSGFYPGSSEKSARETLGKLVAATNPRLEPLKEAERQIKELLVRHSWSTKPKEADKVALLAACRSELPDFLIPWLDAVYSLDSNLDKKGRLFAPLLRTGGNEGSQGYSSTFLQMLIDLGFDESNLRPAAAALLRNALLGQPVQGLVVAKTGMHDPGRAGGPNQGPGIEQTEFLANPWSIILSFEGMLTWCAGSSKRLGAASRAALTSPFTVASTPAAYASAADIERKDREIWAPLWTRPVGYRELATFIAEGRAEVGGRSAVSGVEFAQAVASLGTDRGVSTFVRYGLLERRGQGYFVALPAGRFAVTFRSEADLIRDELQLILDRQLDPFLRSLKDRCPASLTSGRRRINEAIFNLMTQGGQAKVKSLVAELGNLERLLARRDPAKDKRRPLNGLSVRWLAAADDGSIEVRLAAGLASISPAEKIGPLRASLEPVDPIKPWQWAKGGAQTAWFGSSLAVRMASVVRRRLLDAERMGCKRSPFAAPLRLVPEDVAVFIHGDLDEVLLENLLFGFSWIRWNDPKHQISEELQRRWSRPVQERPVPRSFALLKLLFYDAPLKDSSGMPAVPRPEPSIVPLLLAGRVGQACEAARRRLFVSGLSPIRADFPDGENGLRLAAALLFPIKVRKLRSWTLIDQNEIGGRDVRAT